MPFNGVVPAGRFTPAPYGLFSVAKVNNHGAADEHWVGGFDFESEICELEGSVLDICGGDPLVFMDNLDGERYGKVHPFGIRVRDECLTPGFDAIDRKAKIVRQLEMMTQKAVETELWAGNYSQSLDALAPPNQYLTSESAVDVTGGSAGTGGSPVPPVIGLALLEQALAECGPGAQGTIHAPPILGAKIGSQGGEGDGETLKTFNGNLIAFGNGYDGRGPGETTPPADWFTPWVYATGPVVVDLGPAELVTPDFSSAVNPRTNVMSFMAVRPASVFWDGCCHFAVQVDIRL
jgi:hypothetical protein